MRLYQAALLEDFAARGATSCSARCGPATSTASPPATPSSWSPPAGGRLAERFPVLPERSPYTQPQRRLCAGLYRGIAQQEPLSVAFTISPGHGGLRGRLPQRRRPRSACC